MSGGLDDRAPQRGRQQDQAGDDCDRDRQRAEALGHREELASRVGGIGIVEKTKSLPAGS